MTYRTVGLVSLGCPKNQVDAEVMLAALYKEGYQIVDDPADANIIIVNTCGFINDAKIESVNSIIEMGEYREAGNLEYLIVSGCLSQRYGEELTEEMPEIDALIGATHYHEIGSVIKDLDHKSYKSDLTLTDYAGSNDRVVTTPSYMGYIKVAEGCDNRCSYCIIPYLRGNYRSRPFSELIDEAKALANQGAKEITLIAQDTTRYGLDLYGEMRIVNLIDEMSKIDDIKWIRILYGYPEAVDEKLINALAENDKLCSYIDIPFQHASDRMLKIMNRRNTCKEAQDLIDSLRDRVDGIAIRTTFIVGHPGESQEDFDELYEFVAKNRFDNMGVFMYSLEENTPAGEMKEQVPQHIKEQRYNKIMQLQSDIARELQQSQVGKTLRVIIEGFDGKMWSGRHDKQAFNIDGKVYFTSDGDMEIGDFVDVKITEADIYDLIGEA